MKEDVTKELQFAVERTFAHTFRTPVAGRFTPADLRQFPPGSVTSIIEITGHGPTGAIVLAFPSQTIFNLMKEIYRRDFTEVNKSVTDAVGEITNVIYGVFKHRLENYGYQFGLSLPSVTTTPLTSFPLGTWAQAAEFHTPAGPFYVAIINGGTALAQTA